MRSPFDPGPGDEAGAVQRIYAQQTPPLLPSSADLAAHEAALALGSTPLNVLMLGVTPAVYRLPWPPHSAIQAVDRSLPMIEHVWPGPVGSAEVGEWTHLPFPAERFDRVISDGGMTFLGPASIDELRTEVARVLRPDGLFVTRVYVWNQSETLDRLIDDVERGALSTANEMRIRSWSALQTSLDVGIPLSTAFDALLARMGSIETLVERSGLAAEQFVPFLATAGSTLRYTMWPTHDIIAAWTSHGDFEHVSTTIPGHQLGSLCPVLAFRRRGPA